MACLWKYLKVLVDASAVLLNETGQLDYINCFPVHLHVYIKIMIKILKGGAVQHADVVDLHFLAFFIRDLAGWELHQYLGV